MLYKDKELNQMASVFTTELFKIPWMYTAYYSDHILKDGMLGTFAVNLDIHKKEPLGECGSIVYPDGVTSPEAYLVIADCLREPDQLLRFYDTLIHELIHYECWYKGYEWKDGELDFENELKKYGISSNSANHYSKNAKKWCIGNCNVERLIRYERLWHEKKMVHMDFE